MLSILFLACAISGAPDPRRLRRGPTHRRRKPHEPRPIASCFRMHHSDFNSNPVDGVKFYKLPNYLPGHPPGTPQFKTFPCDFPFTGTVKLHCPKGPDVPYDYVIQGACTRPEERGLEERVSTTEARLQKLIEDLELAHLRAAA